jgi:hypothetical protein
MVVVYVRCKSLPADLFIRSERMEMFCTSIKCNGDTSEAKKRFDKLKNAARLTIEREAARDLKGSKCGIWYWMNKFGINKE